MTNDHFDPKGVIPACLMPFDAGLEINESAYRRHLSDLAGVDGVTAITVNGHAAEVHALSFEEQRRAIEIARDELSRPDQGAQRRCSDNGVVEVVWLYYLCRNGLRLVRPTSTWSIKEHIGLNLDGQEEKERNWTQTLSRWTRHGTRSNRESSEEVGRRSSQDDR